MYDTGNFLNTDIRRFVTYTHTRISDTEAQTPDGTIENGETWFGTGSSYFTNKYDKLFVMVATNININEFYISGELGADGSGSQENDVTTLTYGGNTYTLFYKKIYGSGDPSVNHLIIVPGDKTSATHTVGVTTDDDFDKVSDLSGVNRIAYLLFATGRDTVEGGEDEEIVANVPEEDLIAIAQEFLNTTSGFSNIATALSSLNSDISSVVSVIPNPSTFEDDYEGTESFGAVYNIESLIYIGNDTFCMTANSRFYKFTEAGNVLIERTADIFDTNSYLFYANDILYAFGFGNYYGIIDLTTGEGANNDDKKYQSISWATEDYGSISSIGPVVQFNNKVYALCEAANDVLVELNLEENTAEFVGYLSNGDIQALVSIPAETSNNYSIGFSSENFYDFWGWWYRIEEFIIIEIRRSYLFIEPTLSNIAIQYTTEQLNSESDVESLNWQSITLDHIVDETESNGIWKIYLNDPVEVYDYLYFRIRYINDDSNKWFYVQED